MNGKDAGFDDNNITVPVTSATLSTDGKHVKLQLGSTATRRMYAITANAITSAPGAQPM